MSDLFDRLLLPRVLDVEKGYVNHPSDKGGETNFGITIATARANGYTGRMRDMTVDVAASIYRTEYFARPGLYLIAPLSARVTEELFDSGVLHGQGAAARWFQWALNGLNGRGKLYADIREDGAIGPATAGAFAAYLKKRGAPAETVMLRALDGRQSAFLQDLARASETQEDFLFGWLAHRVENVERAA